MTARTTQIIKQSIAYRAKYRVEFLTKKTYSPLCEVLAVRAAALDPYVCPKNKTHWLASSAMVMVGPVGILEVNSDWRKLENKGNTEWRTLSETRGCGVQLQGPLEVVVRLQRRRGSR